MPNASYSDAQIGAAPTLATTLAALTALQQGRANVDLTQTQTQQLPKQTDISLMQALAAQRTALVAMNRLPYQNFNDSFGKSPEAIKAKVIANNPGAFNQLIMNPLMGGAYGMGGTGMGMPFQDVTQNILNRDFPQFVNQQGMQQGVPPQGQPGGVAQPGMMPPGMAPGQTPQQGQSGMPLTPLQLQQLSAQQNQPQQNSTDPTGLAAVANDVIGMKTHTPFQIQRAVFGQNVAKTTSVLDNFIGAATSYASHPADYGTEKINAARNKPTSPQYQQAQEFYNLMPQFTNQVRQFYGDSIQPEAKKDLEDLVSPDFWMENPQIARQKYETYKSVLASERGTTDIPTSQLFNPQVTDQNAQQAGVSALKSFNSVAPNGVVTTGKVLLNGPHGPGYVPAGRVNAYLKNGYSKGQ